MAKICDEIRRNYRNQVLEMRLRAQYKKQKDFAAKTGISPSILCDIESNRLFLSSFYALRIAEVLGCNLDDLYIKR